MFSPLLNDLVLALRCLPGVGPKSAQRMAFYLLQHNRNGGLELAGTLQKALAFIQHCQKCRIFCEEELCQFCSPGAKREHSVICVVEMPADVWAIEQTKTYRGIYFVLMGKLSPLDGIGPQELGLSDLLQRIQEEKIKEVILATNLTPEGEATAYYLNKMLPKDIKITRIAHGVPLGSELECIHPQALAQALSKRETMC